MTTLAYYMPLTFKHSSAKDMNSFSPDDRANYSRNYLSAIQPACEIIEGPSHYSLRIEMPGISKDRIKIEAANQKLIVSGERVPEESGSSEELVYSERTFGKVMRVFNLPSNTDTSTIEATLEDGILHLVVPKSENLKTREIKIGSSASSLLKSLMGSTGKDKVQKNSEPLIS